ncbi:hypothetical protein R3P38DRAFT_3187396 [Favolaschia claudopus]|uniref:Uncharacterized protein n=1 Tax=Favolaschia claudopus TaxID=2862362 RepID=A0AAW0BZF6_9AGAR
MAAEDLGLDDAADSERNPERSPIPSLISCPPSPTGDEYPVKAEDGEGAPAATAEQATAPPVHQVQLVNIYGTRMVQCGCVDGKHGELRRRQTYAFEASDGTVVIKKFRTMIVALN